MARSDDNRRYPPLHPTRYKIMLWVLAGLVRLLIRLDVKGVDNVPQEGATILVTNHLHYLDTPAVGITIPRMGYVLAAEKYENHVFGPILKTGGAIFINRGEADRRALRMAMNVLEDGKQLAIAVEGTRSDTGALAKGKTGAAYLATRTNAPLVPVVVWGTEDIIPTWKRLRRPTVHVRYGEPFRLPEGRARSAQLEQYTDEIMATLAAMLPAEYRGAYADHPLTQAKLAQGTETA